MKNDVRVYFHRFLYIYLQYYLHAIKYSLFIVTLFTKEIFIYLQKASIH